VRRTGEYFPIFLQFPNPALNHPCGTSYVLGECNYCPSGQIGCLPPAVCTLGSVGNYICAFASSSGPAQYAARRKKCGQSCIPVDADCCGTGATYCLAPKHCGARPDGSNACFDSVAASSSSTTSVAQITSVAQTTSAAQTSTRIGGGQLSFQSSSTTPGSPPTSAASSISAQSGTPTISGAVASQTAKSLGTGVENSSWAVGGVFAMLVVTLLSY
jgi:hypothetical protein